MIPTLVTLRLAFLDIQPFMIAIIVPIAGLLFGGAIAGMAMYFSHQRQRLWHETARLALEKGQPLPASFDVASRAAGDNAPRWRGYFIGGLINVGVGVGLFFALSQIPGTAFNVGYFGAIPGFIGVALLIGAAIEALASRRSADSTQPQNRP